ncbi:cyclophilin-like fold protein [Arthrobacter sp. Alg241-R88]|uniref:cyclophilin-like fold protein n=1 Tax=Arthrobacter sp. Alg241-R88 TaxID=2305984 RepID=UPI0013D143AC|nr:cyclophilin-like fold protein [Arthrobacter sp. Alg241-R88]
MRLKMRALVAIIALAVPLAGCNTTSNGPASTPEPPSSPTETSTAAEGSSSQPSPVPSSPADSTPITIEIDGGTVTGTLSGNATARSLIGQLPLTLSFRDYGGQEKIAELPEALSLDGVPAGASAEPLTIGYYAPDQALVLYYERVAYSRGIVRIGSFHDLAAIQDQTSGFNARLAPAN